MHFTNENYWSNRCVQWLCARKNTNRFWNKNRTENENTKYRSTDVEIIELNHIETLYGKKQNGRRKTRII